MGKKIILCVTSCIMLMLASIRINAQTTPASADTASYLLGVSSETTPGAALTYTITITNFGPGIVHAFYILDGWTVNTEGISAFATPLAEPDFGTFSVVGSWQQARPDQKVIAWLLNGELAAGKTVQFNWKVNVASNYIGTLVNWSKIQTSGVLSGTWEPRKLVTIVPPSIDDAVDPDEKNNRTDDGVTLVSDAPTEQGVDMAIYQTGLLKQLEPGGALSSTLFITNLGPQTVNQFYLMAGWSVDTDGKSVLQAPASDPDFGDLRVLGAWQSITADEERWLWLLEGDLDKGQSVALPWKRNIAPSYRGDLVNWVSVSPRDVPPGDWIPRADVATLSAATPDGSPTTLETPADTNPKNNRSVDLLTTIGD